MTEAQWLTCNWAPSMVEFLWEKGSKRKMRLLTVACCLRIVHLATEARYRDVVGLLEAFVEEKVSLARLETAKTECLAEPLPRGNWLDPEYAATHVLMHLPYLCLHNDPAAHYLDFRSFIQIALAGTQATVNSEQWHAVQATEQEAESNLVRDIFGNPFRPFSFRTEWRTEAVTLLAKHIYESRDFSAMAILADALEESGCSDEDILSHCRGNGPHVRGCHVIDMILGK